MFKPYLVDGAIVAMHDVLGTFEGALRVFVEEVLDSDDFGPAGASADPLAGRSTVRAMARPPGFAGAGGCSPSPLGDSSR